MGLGKLTKKAKGPAKIPFDLFRKNKLHQRPQVGLVCKEQMIEIISWVSWNEIVKTSVANYQARCFGWAAECYFMPAFFSVRWQ